MHHRTICQHRSVLPLLLLTIAGVAGSARAAEKPNIVFVLADDLGYKDVGFTGATFYETPNLDALAKGGMIFNRAYSCGPNCAPTRACLISGTYTPRHHIYTPGGQSKGDHKLMRLLVPSREGPKVDFPPSAAALQPSVVSFAEVLKEAGYATGHFGKWHVGPDPQGFDEYGSDGTPGKQGKHYGSITVADQLTDAGVKFIDKHKGRPFFLYVAHWDVHTPIRAKKDVVEKYKKKLESVGGGWNPTYAGMIEAVDKSVGRLRAALAKHDIDDNTLFIFSSDNGGVPGITRNLPLRGGKGSLFEGGIRVPTCMTWPAVVKAGATSDTPISSVDFLPTFVELGGSKLPTSQPVDGRSLAPVLRGDPKALKDRAIFWFYPLYLQGGAGNAVVPVHGTDRMYWRGVPAAAIVKGDWKLIRYFEDDSVKLFDLAKDIGEHRDLAAAEPDRAKALRTELDTWLKATKAPIPTKLNPAFSATAGAGKSETTKPPPRTRGR